jgi:hypothetical protein
MGEGRPAAGRRLPSPAARRLTPEEIAFENGRNRMCDYSYRCGEEVRLVITTYPAP